MRLKDLNDEQKKEFVEIFYNEFCKFDDRNCSRPYGLPWLDLTDQENELEADNVRGLVEKFFESLTYDAFFVRNNIWNIEFEGEKIYLDTPPHIKRVKKFPSEEWDYVYVAHGFDDYSDYFIIWNKVEDDMSFDTKSYTIIKK